MAQAEQLTLDPSLSLIQLSPNPVGSTYKICPKPKFFYPSSAPPWPSLLPLPPGHTATSTSCFHPPSPPAFLRPQQREPVDPRQSEPSWLRSSPAARHSWKKQSPSVDPVYLLLTFPSLTLLQPPCYSSAPTPSLRIFAIAFPYLGLVFCPLTFLHNSLSHFLQVFVPLPLLGKLSFPAIENRSLTPTSPLTPAP